VSNGAGIEDLLRELRGAASPVQRVKLLGRAWRSLRRFDRHQLQDLARRAGFDQAEGFLERLARDKGRLTPSLLLQIVQRARNVDEGDVDNLVRGLRDPERREELLHGGIEFVADMLDEPSSEVEEEAVAAPPPEEPEEDEPPPPPPEPEIEPAQPAPPVVPEIAAAEPEQKIAPEPLPVEEPAPKPVAPIAVAVVPAVAPAFAAPPAASAPEVRVTPEPVETPDGDTDAVVNLLTSTPSTQRRLGILRNELDRIGKLDVDALQRLLELFPAGWARRRALAALLRAGIPAKLMHAVFLIEQLESPTARRWCVGALLDGRQLDPDERAALIERHGLFPHRRH
jgi:hypothetical protein